MKNSGIFEAKAEAYKRAYYPKPLRGKVTVEIDYKNGTFKLKKVIKE